MRAFLSGQLLWGVNSSKTNGWQWSGERGGAPLARSHLLPRLLLREIGAGSGERGAGGLGLGVARWGTPMSCSRHAVWDPHRGGGGGTRLLEDLEGLDARGHGEGVARERARLVHGPGRRHLGDMV